MDKVYNDILKILTEDSRAKPSEIAVMLGKKEAEIDKAIKDMEKKGIILKYSVIVDNEKTEREMVEAFIEVRVSPMLNRGFDAIAEDICQFPEVKSLYLMSGGYDLAVVIEGRTLREVATFVSEKLSMMDKVISTATHFILKKYKFEGALMQNQDQNKRLVIHA